MRKLLFLLLLISLSVAAVAQQGPAAGKPVDVNKRVANMTQHLNLTPDQASKITTILQNEQKQIADLRGGNTQPTPETRQKMRAVRQDSHKQLMAVLTPEQQQKMGRGAAHQGQARAFQAGRRQGMMEQALNLTDDQKAQIKTMRQDQQKQMVAVRQDNSLTSEQRMAKMREIRKAGQEKYMNILTPEQRQQVQNFRQQRHGNRQASPKTPTPGM